MTPNIYHDLPKSALLNSFDQIMLVLNMFDIPDCFDVCCLCFIMLKFRCYPVLQMCRSINQVASHQQTPSGWLTAKCICLKFINVIFSKYKIYLCQLQNVFVSNCKVYLQMCMSINQVASHQQTPSGWLSAKP